MKVLIASKCDEEKNSFTNQVVKDNFVFPLFLFESIGFEFKRCDFDLFFSLFEKLGDKKVYDARSEGASLFLPKKSGKKSCSGLLKKGVGFLNRFENHSFCQFKSDLSNCQI